MPPSIVELGQVLLANPTDKIQLSAICAAFIQLPQSIVNLNHTDILEALTSGHIWTTRGIGCALDIDVLFNGKPLDNHQQSLILDTLGRRLREAQLWSQLSLLPTLEINDIKPKPYRPNISIAIKYAQPYTTMKAGSGGWLLDKTDVAPPKDVLRAEIERIQLQLNFLTINVPDPAETRIEEFQEDEPELRLPDQALVKPNHLALLENAVRSMENLSQSVALGFGHPISILPRQNSLGSKETFSMCVMGKSHVIASSASSMMKRLAVTRKKKFPKEVTDVLERWLESHSSNPYPTEEEKQELMQRTGLKRSQLNDWMGRSRQKMPAISSRRDEEEMLFSTIISPNDPFEDDPTDLLSQSSADTLSLTSQISTPSTTASIVSTATNLSPSAIKEISRRPILLLDSSSAGRLMGCALQTFIGGYYPKIRLHPGIQIEKPTPETSLSQLVPTMFNPGYRQLMAHNFRFLHTITQALTVTLPKNVQSPSLRKKLEQLAKLRFSPLAVHDPEPSDHDPNERLSQVLQTRLFSMMQRTLYDPSATRKLWKKAKNQTESDEPLDRDEDSSPDLLGDEGLNDSQWDDILADFPSDDEFDDLLYDEAEDDDDEFDLLDGSERERMGIERETDEMLLGDGWTVEDVEDEEDDFLLLEGDSDDENMLL